MCFRSFCIQDHVPLQELQLHVLTTVSQLSPIIYYSSMETPVPKPLDWWVGFKPTAPRSGPLELCTAQATRALCNISDHSSAVRINHLPNPKECILCHIVTLGCWLVRCTNLLCPYCIHNIWKGNTGFVWVKYEELSVLLELWQLL